MIWSVTVGTIFPDLFPGALGISCAEKARKNNIWSLNVESLFNFACDAYRQIDDAPFGGGPGMIMKPGVIDDFFSQPHLINVRKIYMSPRGKIFNQNMAKDLINQDLCIVCGRYEGLDVRVINHWNVEEISVGDFIVFGGEIPAMILLEACVRLLPNVINKNSLLSESLTDYLLEHDQYTRPASWSPSMNKNLVYNVPDVLLSGNHQKIQKWRASNSKLTTQKKRQDLWHQHIHSKEDV